MGEIKVERPNKLGVEPVGKLLMQMAIPTVMGQLINLLYNIVDRIFVGRIPVVGELSLAGLGVTFPIIMLISAFAALVGMGGAPRAAIAMGEGDYNRAEKILGNSMSLLLIFSVSCSSIFMLTKDFILLAFGASEATLPFANDYLSIYLLGTIFVQITLGLNAFITNQGFAKTSMMTLLLGATLNIILDPIFIFGLNMGVKGAAIATIISQGASALWVLSFLVGKKSKLKVRKVNFILEKKIVVGILSLGISPFIMQSTECLIQLTFNSGMQTYGNDSYVAIMAILFSLTQLIFLPISGIGQGALPIMGYNYGAKNMQRVRETSKILFKLCFGFATTITAMMVIFPEVFLGLFTDSQELIELGVIPTRIFLIGMASMGAQHACQQTFLALGEAKISMFLALLRKVVLIWPLALILPHIGGLGIWGLLLAEPIGDVLAATTTTIMYKLKSKELLKG